MATSSSVDTHPDDDDDDQPTAKRYQRAGNAAAEEREEEVEEMQDAAREEALARAWRQKHGFNAADPRERATNQIGSLSIG